MEYFHLGRLRIFIFIGRSLRTQRPSSPPLRGFFRDLVPRPLQKPLRFCACGRFDLRSRSGAGASIVPSGLQRGRAVPPSAQTLPLRSLRPHRSTNPSSLRLAPSSPGFALDGLFSLASSALSASGPELLSACSASLDFTRTDQPARPRPPVSGAPQPAPAFASGQIDRSAFLRLRSTRPCTPASLPALARYAQVTCVRFRSGPV